MSDKTGAVTPENTTSVLSHLAFCALAARGVTEPHHVINRMMGYTPELHQIWTGTTDKELMALTWEYPGFYRYAFIMETALEQESQKPSRPYDGQPEFSAANKHTMELILTTAATLERIIRVMPCRYLMNRLPGWDSRSYYGWSTWKTSGKC